MGKLTKIVVHWSGGTYEPSISDHEHYHYMIDNKGKLYTGKYNCMDNIDCVDSVYAHHTGGGNTGAIGISMLGMCGFKNFKNIGKYPLTRKQCETTFCTIAGLCKKYGIDPDNVITHYEFGKAHQDSESAGKIDIIYLPPYQNVKANDVGNFIRGKVRWYMANGGIKCLRII